MYNLSNNHFSAIFNQNGRMTSLKINSDESKMNWLIDEQYLQEHGYSDQDKLFGLFEIKIDGKTYNNQDYIPEINCSANKIEVNYKYDFFSVVYDYFAEGDKPFTWSITLLNHSSKPLIIENFSVWFSPAYIMFRDTNVLRNMNHSCAVFPHLSDHFTKLAAVKRDNAGPNLGIFNTKGKTLSVGSFCRYQNRFREQVSPSLDGAIYHQFLLAGKEQFTDSHDNDWIYHHLYNNEFIIEPNHSEEWEYSLFPFQNREEFLLKGLELAHPAIKYSPVVIDGGKFSAEVTIPKGEKIAKSFLISKTSNGYQEVDITKHFVRVSNDKWVLDITVSKPGEKKMVIELENRKIDFIVFNVMEPIHRLIESRANYLCQEAYIDDESNSNAFGFKPISNQGESLGKLCFILQKNLVAMKYIDQIKKVEKSAVFYVKNKWFVNGDFTNPCKIHGDFYRTLDFDYIVHVYFLLSRFKKEDLTYHSPTTYLKWAGELLSIRFDKTKHGGEREKKEAEMNGVFNLYINDLLEALEEEGLEEECEKLNQLWTGFCSELLEEVKGYKAAITEHHYDNAGFGPACESLCISGHLDQAKHYGELILANIGFSNDFRNQNPDRWWEALSFMVHSLWGGLVSHSALVAYNHFNEIDYLKASYRSMMAVLYCYDWHASASGKVLAKGTAASTYSVSNPNINKPSLSHNRFGQSVFLEDDGELFAGNATGDDWDMGEELVAYLKGFGTTTYIYIENGELACINGYIEKVEDQQIKIISYAAYPKQYQFRGIKMDTVIADQEEMIPEIYLIKDENGNYKCVQRESQLI